MANRNKVLVDYNDYFESLVYAIYRQDDNDEMILIAEMDESLVEKVVSQTKNDILVQDFQVSMLFTVDRIYLLDPPPKVYVDDVLIDNLNISFMPLEKSIMFSGIPIYVNTTQVIKMDYSHTSYKFIDDALYQEGITYLGPTVTAAPKPVINRVDIREDLSAKIIDDTDLFSVGYTYQIKAINTLNDQAFSHKHEIHLTFDPVKWILEGTMDDIVWTTRLIVTDPELLIDPIPTGDKPCFTEEIQVIPTTSTTADLVIPNPWYAATPNRRVYSYRLILEDSAGAVSVPSDPTNRLINTIYIENKSLKVRRYVNVSEASSYDGLDAVDVHTITIDDVDVLAPHITLVDDHLSPNTDFGWTFFLTDIKDVISDGVFVQAATGGDTA